MRELSLYFHVPYCVSKCHYCDFISYPNMINSAKDYFAAVVSEIDMYDFLKGSQIKSIFFGGGTPTIVEPEYIYYVLEKCKSKFNFNNDIEISIESNPDSLDGSKLRQYKNMGINRLSIGLQTWQNEILKSLGRIHTVEQFINGFNLARENGFDNINVDLMFALPNQTIEQWEDTLNNVVALNPEHLSCYSLKIEPKTKFYKLQNQGNIVLPDDETDREMYYLAKSILLNNSYKQYEVSNFSKPGFECKHNMTYWTSAEYIGFGAGAHSFFDNKRTANISKIEGYIKSIKKGKFAYVSNQDLTQEILISEYIITRLRLTEGLNKKEFYDKFGISINDLYSENISKFVLMGLIVDEWDHVRFTDKGFDLSNIVLMEFV